MTMFKIVIFHVLLFGIALSSPIENKVTEKKPISATTTYTPLKVITAKNVNNEQVQNANNAQSKKSATKKRNVPEILTDKNEYFDDDFYEGRETDDYDNSQALRTFLDNSRNDNLVLDSGKFRVDGYRYLDEESRKKRTTAVDNYREPETNQISDLRLLAAYRHPHHLYNTFPYGRWTDISNSVELPDTDVEIDDSYDRPENFFDRYYDQRYQNWANFPRNNKFIMNRQRNYSGFPKLRVPIYKRAVL